MANDCRTGSIFTKKAFAKDLAQRESRKIGEGVRIGQVSIVFGLNIQFDSGAHGRFQGGGFDFLFFYCFN